MHLSPAHISMTPPVFGDVRAVVQGLPSEDAWHVLCDMLARWPSDVERDEVVLPYVREGVKSWPNEMRIAPWVWLAPVIEGEPEVCFTLARHVVLDQRVYRYAVKRLLWRSVIHQMRRLTLSNNHLDARVLKRVVRSPYLQAMEGITIETQQLSYDALESFRHLSVCRHLRHFALNQVGMDARRTRALRRCGDVLFRLQSLSLSRNLIGAEGVAYLLSLGVWTQLHALDLSHCHLDDDGLLTLASSDALSALTDLNLSGNGLSDPDGLKHLSRAPFFSSLTSLNLGLNFWRAKALALELREWSPTSLDALHVPSVGLSASDMPLWSTIDWLGALKTLDLSNNALSDQGVVQLLCEVAFESLEVLKLSNTNLTDEALITLSQHAHMSQLHTLDVDKNFLEGPGIVAMLESERFPQLRHISCRGNRLSSEAISALSQSSRLDLPTRLHWHQMTSP